MVSNLMVVLCGDQPASPIVNTGTLYSVSVGERKQVLLRMDPAVHDALARWAADELRSLNAHIEMLLRRALDDAGRMPKQARPLPKRGRPTRRLTRQRESVAVSCQAAWALGIAGRASSPVDVFPAGLYTAS